MALDPTRLGPESLSFLTERHLATLTTVRPDGTPHVVPVGFTWDDDTALARVITSSRSLKARNAVAAVAAGGGRAVLCQVDGRRWLSLEGSVGLLTDRDSVVEAEQRYAVRYRQPRPNPERVVLTISVDRALGSLGRSDRGDHE